MLAVAGRSMIQGGRDMPMMNSQMVNCKIGVYHQKQQEIPGSFPGRLLAVDHFMGRYNAHGAARKTRG